MPKSQPDAALSSSGSEIGGLTVPAFTVHRGDLVRIQFPVSAGRELEQFWARLSHPSDKEFVRKSGRVAIVDWSTLKIGWFERFRRLTALEWFSKQTRISQQEARLILEIEGVHADAPLSALAATPRWLLAFHAARLCGADIITFRTEGLDPRGVQTAFDVASGSTDELGLLYLTCRGAINGVREPQWSTVVSIAPLHADAAVV